MFASQVMASSGHRKESYTRLYLMAILFQDVERRVYAQTHVSLVHNVTYISFSSPLLLILRREITAAAVVCNLKKNLPMPVPWKRKVLSPGLVISLALVSRGGQCPSRPNL